MPNEREWTGSVTNLPESIRTLAQQLMAQANEHPESPLASFMQDHAWTLTEWADAVEQLYARLDEGEVVTNAQGVALARFLRRGWRTAKRADQSARVSLGGLGLPEKYLLVTMADGFTGGIDPEGRVST